jgi:hypothetical protein
LIHLFDSLFDLLYLRQVVNNASATADDGLVLSVLPNLQRTKYSDGEILTTFQWQPPCSFSAMIKLDNITAYGKLKLIR